jgi:DNA-binding SARP family transcriptional activator
MEIRLLGPTVVRRRNGEIVDAKEWRTAKSLELVRSLALSPDEPVPATVLLERLWPGVEQAKAQGSLRNALFHIRRVLGEDAVERRGDGLVLLRAWTDVQAYAALAEQVRHAHRAGDHEQVAALCRASEALYVRDIDTDGAGDWITAVQLRWRELRLEVLLASCETADRLCRVREALDLAMAALELDPTSERGTRVLMRAFGALGEAKKALSAYERLRTALAESYGIDPSPQTRALHLELLTRLSGAVDDGHVGPEPLVGQVTAVEALTAALLQMAGCAPQETRGGVVWMVGAPGSGRAAVARAAARRVNLRPRQTPVPVGRIATLVTSPATLSSRELLMVPETDTVSAGDVARLNAWAAQTGSLVVVPVEQLGVEAHMQVLDDARTPLAPIVQIDPLPQEQVAELLAHVLQGSPAPGLVDTVMASTSGRSGRVCDAARQWLRDGLIIWTPGGMTLGVEPDAGALFPPTRSVLRSLGVLDTRALETLAVVAVAGEPLTAAAVDRALLHLDPEHPGDARWLLSTLADAGALEVTPDGYLPRTDVDRTAVLSWLRPARRRRLHTAVTSVAPEEARRLRVEHRPDVEIDALVTACDRGDYDRARELLDKLTRGRAAALLAPIETLASWDFAVTALGMLGCA